MEKVLTKERQTNNFSTIVAAIALFNIMAIALLIAFGTNDTPDGSDSENKPDSKKR